MLAMKNRNDGKAHGVEGTMGAAGSRTAAAPGARVDTLVRRLGRHVSAGVDIGAGVCIVTFSVGVGARIRPPGLAALLRCVRRSVARARIQRGWDDVVGARATACQACYYQKHAHGAIQDLAYSEHRIVISYSCR